jgi:hypothetical protein
MFPHNSRLTAASFGNVSMRNSLQQQRQKQHKQPILVFALGSAFFASLTAIFEEAIPPHRLLVRQTHSSNLTNK